MQATGPCARVVEQNGSYEVRLIRALSGCYVGSLEASAQCGGWAVIRR